MASRVPLFLKLYPEENAELRSKASEARLTLVDFIISQTTQAGAWRANRVRGPVTAHTVAAEEEARRIWWAGDPSSGSKWSAVDHVLADLGPTLANIDFRASLLAEQMLRRPDVVQTAYNKHLIGDDPAPLTRSAFIEWFEEEDEAALDAFSIDDTAKLLVCDGTGDYEATLAATASNRGEHLEYCLAEAERAGVAGRRAHTRRILRDWRERGIPWPKIEIDRHGTPVLADGTRIEFQVINNRRQPVLTSEPRVAKPVPAQHQLTSPLAGKTMNGRDV